MINMIPVFWELIFTFLSYFVASYENEKVLGV